MDHARIGREVRLRREPGDGSVRTGVLRRHGEHVVALQRTHGPDLERADHEAGIVAAVRRARIRLVGDAGEHVALHDAAVAGRAAQVRAVQGAAARAARGAAGRGAGRAGRRRAARGAARPVAVGHAREHVALHDAAVAGRAAQVRAVQGAAARAARGAAGRGAGRAGRRRAARGAARPVATAGPRRVRRADRVVALRLAVEAVAAVGHDITGRGALDALGLVALGDAALAIRTLDRIAGRRRARAAAITACAARGVTDGRISAACGRHQHHTRGHDGHERPKHGM